MHRTALLADQAEGAMEGAATEIEAVDMAAGEVGDMKTVHGTPTSSLCRRGVGITTGTAIAMDLRVTAGRSGHSKVVVGMTSRARVAGTDEHRCIDSKLGKITPLTISLTR